MAGISSGFRAQTLQHGFAALVGFRSNPSGLRLKGCGALLEKAKK